MKILSIQPALCRSEQIGSINRRVTGVLWFMVLGILLLPAQKQSNIWYFGRNAGLDFSNYHPMPRTDGWFDAPNGVATYCDAKGELLFCSDGRRLWNRNHIKIRSDLSGDPESTHAATFVPSLWNPNELYLFTTTKYHEGEENWGGDYYTIDLSNPLNLNITHQADVTGKGGLIENSTEKILFIPTTFFDDVTGTQEPGYWILMHEFGNNRFRFFKFWGKGLEDAGFQDIGTAHANGADDDGSNRGASGQIKASISGKLVAVAVEGGKFFEYYSFDLTTGRLQWRFNTPLPAGEKKFKDQYLHGAFGVEFSPTGNYLYGSARDLAYVYQWDLSAYSGDVIIKSCQFLSENTASQGGGMQLAPNGKIYVAFHNQPYLGVIHSPLLWLDPTEAFSKFGACLVDNSNNEGGTSSFGLPATIPGSLTIPLISYTKNCSNDTIMFFLVNPGNIVGNRFWFFKNLNTGKMLASPRPTQTNQTQILLPPAGQYQVRCICAINGKPDTLEIAMDIYDPPDPDLAEDEPHKVCKGRVIQLDAKYGAFYEWDDKSLKSRYRLIDVDTLPYPLNPIRVEVTDYNGCVGDEIIQLQPTTPPNFTTYSAKATCGQSNGSAWVLPDNGDPTKFIYLWEYDSSTRYKLENIPFGAYPIHVWAKTPPNCEVVDTILVSDFSVQSAEISSVDSTICPGSRVTLRVVGEVDEFEWINPKGATGREVDVFPTDTTVYTLKITSYDGANQCYSYVDDTVYVYPVNKPEIDNYYEGCAGDTIRIEGGSGYVGWTWSDGFSGEVNPVTLEKAKLILFATDDNRCTFTDTTQVHFKPIPLVNLGPDTTYCSTTPITLSGGVGEEYEWSTSALGETISVTQNDSYWLKITTDGCSARDTVQIRINNPDLLRIDSLLHRDVSCNGANDGEIRIVPSGQGLEYYYSIDNGITFVADSLFQQLPPSDKYTVYQVVVWEDSACRVAWPEPVLISEPEVLEAKYCANPPSCSTCSDGSITLSNITGGTPPYYYWLDGKPASSTLIDLIPGTYQVEITDANGCRWNAELPLVAGTNVHIEASTNQPVCPGTPVTLTVVNGSGIEWIDPPGITGESTVVVPEETTVYRAQSKKVDDDDFECIIVAEYTVQVIPHIDPELGEDLYRCVGDIITLDAGDGYQNYLWSTGETSRTINLTATHDPVFVTVTDTHNCRLSDTVSVFVNPYPEVDLGNDRSICTNQSIELSGGTGDAYAWSTGEVTDKIRVNQSDNYSLTITTIGCSATDTVKVTILNPDELLLSDPLVQDNTCFGHAYGSIEIRVQGTGTEFLYSIDDGDTWQDSPLFDSLPAGDNYRIRVSEDSICFKDYPDWVTIGEPDSIHLEVRLKSPSCIGCSDGQIIIREITGGEPPYLVTMNGVEQGLTITGLAEGDYVLTITDNQVCSIDSTFKIDMNNIIPNVITPDGDGLNEKWIIPLLKYYPDAIVTLFDTRGHTIHTFDPGYPDPWDGTDEKGREVPMGTYYYVITSEEENLVWKGFVMVVR